MPNEKSVHVDAALTDFAVGYMQSAQNFAAMRTFLPIPVMKQSDKYFVWDAGAFNRDTLEKVVGSTKTPRATRKVSTDTYFADIYKGGEAVSYAARDNSDPAVNLEQSATRMAMNSGLIKLERLFAQSALVTGVWGNEATGVAGSPSTGQFKQWSDAASDPINDIQNAIDAAALKSGFKPNVLTLSYPVFVALKNHPEFVDRIKYGQTPGSAAVVNEQAIAALFGLDEVIVSSAIYNTANEGATAANAYCFGKTALLSYRPASVDLMTPCAGAAFSWNGHTAGAVDGVAIDSFDDNDAEETIYRAKVSTDFKVTGSEMGYLFLSAVA